MAKYEFAIKKDVLNSGKTIYTPVCRKKSEFPYLRIFNNPWERISRIYDRYTLMELHFTPELSYEECQKHIQGYQQTLSQLRKDEIATAELHLLETQEI